MEAWIKRDSERQKLLAEVRASLVALGEHREYWRDCLQLSLVITDHLSGNHLARHRHANEFTFKRIKLMVDEFARSEAEGRYLLLRIVENLHASAMSDFRTLLSREEVADPRKMFMADHAMSEVD